MPAHVDIDTSFLEDLDFDTVLPCEDGHPTSECSILVKWRAECEWCQNVTLVCQRAYEHTMSGGDPEFPSWQATGCCNKIWWKSDGPGMFFTPVSL